MAETIRKLKYRVVKCYQCGEPMQAAHFDEIWDMRIGGELHNIPLYSIPCMYCPACEISVVDQSSDEPILACQKKYLDENGLNTPYLRIKRWWLRTKARWECWYWNRVNTSWKRLPAD